MRRQHAVVYWQVGPGPRNQRRAASFSSSVSGSKSSWRVPSAHGLFSVSTMRPSSSRRSRSCATAGEAGRPGLLLHDIRRSAVRNLERAGISRSVVMKLTGHKTEAVYRRCAIVAESDLRDAGTKLTAMLGTTSEPARLSDSSGDNSVTAPKTRRLSG